MRLTLGSALPLLARYAVQGACQTDPRVIEKINEARERLMTKPQNWKGKIQRFRFCASQACITLPREIETVEAATICNQPQRMRSPWYDVLEGGPGSGSYCGGDSVIDRGDGYVSFADLDTPRHIKVYADVNEATDAKLLLQGFDQNGNRVRTWDEANNEYVDGEYVGINNATPQISTTVFSVLDGIQKPETSGFVRLYAFTAGHAGIPPSDITTVTNWTGTNPAPGTIQWEGTASSIGWLGGADEDVDIIIQIYKSAGVYRLKVYDINGNESTGAQWDAFNWTENPPASGVGDLVAQAILLGTVPELYAGDLAFTLSDFVNPDILADANVVLRFTRDVTAEVIGVADYLSLMSILHPGETLPSYRRYEVPGLRRSCCGGNTEEEQVNRQVIVMAKLRYLPVQKETDFLVIENLGALKQMLLAINEEEKGQFQLAMAFEAKAEQILADELRNHIGDAATANQGMQIQQDCWAASTIETIL